MRESTVRKPVNIYCKIQLRIECEEQVLITQLLVLSVCIFLYRFGSPLQLLPLFSLLCRNFASSVDSTYEYWEGYWNKDEKESSSPCFFFPVHLTCTISFSFSILPSQHKFTSKNIQQFTPSSVYKTHTICCYIKAIRIGGGCHWNATL